MAIPVFRPSVKRKDMDAVLTCLVSDQLGPGEYAENLVHSLLEKTDSEGGALLRERLRGMEILIRSLELPDASRVAVSALSADLYAYALSQLGHEAVIIDVREDAPVMDLELLAARHGEDPLAAVILENHLGYSPDVENMKELNLPLIQDISGIFYIQPRPEYIGDFLLLNLDPENIITTGGGVFIAAARRKQSKQLSSVVDSYPRDIYLPDMNAAMGGIQLKEMKGFLEVRQELQGILQRSIMESRHKMLPVDEQLVPSCLPVLLNGSLHEAQQYGVKKQVEILPAFEDSIISALMRNYELDSEGEQSPAEKYPRAAGFSLRTALLPLFPSMGRRELELLQKVVKSLP